MRRFLAVGVLALIACDSNAPERSGDAVCVMTATTTRARAERVRREAVVRPAVVRRRAGVGRQAERRRALAPRPTQRRQRRALEAALSRRSCPSILD
jgi:hypothetical protein